jgi:hypothetical protein
MTKSSHFSSVGTGYFMKFRSCLTCRPYGTQQTSGAINVLHTCRPYGAGERDKNINIAFLLLCISRVRAKDSYNFCMIFCSNRCVQCFKR